MNELTEIIAMSLLAVFGFYTAEYEKRKREENKNDERWQAITSKADHSTLIFVELILIIVMGILTFGSWGTVQKIFFIKYLAQPIHLAPLLSVFLYILPFAIFSFRHFALRHFDKNM